MDGTQIGYARVSTADQDFRAQRDALLPLGVEEAYIYVDHGMTGTKRNLLFELHDNGEYTQAEVAALFSVS